MSIEKYLSLSDEEYNIILWEGGSMEIEDPFFDSVIRKKRKSPYDNDQYEEIEEVCEEESGEEEID